LALIIIASSDFFPEIHTNKCRNLDFVTGKLQRSILNARRQLKLGGILSSLRGAQSRIDNAVRTQMSLPVKRRNVVLTVAVVLLILVSGVLAFQASSIPASRLINPDELVKVLQSSKGEKPLMIQVGSHVLYAQAHIPGSEYIGPASNESGLQALRKRVEPLPRKKFIVLYCGCCPWSHCPNVKPADDALHAMGFTNVKVLYIAGNFGMEWVEKGYPVAKGE
jgi:thiosulfate/3-mercaptopyruvate sulfurtransferase